MSEKQEADASTNLTVSHCGYPTETNGQAEQRKGETYYFLQNFYFHVIGTNKCNVSVHCTMNIKQGIMPYKQDIKCPREEST